MFITDIIFVFLRASGEEDILRAFGWAVVSLFLALLVLGFPKRTRRPVRQFAPGVLTSVGILGTFAGITSGLLTFDSDDINASVPRLLEGLKVAFGTSILGLILALLYRLFFLLLDAVMGKEEEKEEIDPIEELRAIREALEQSGSQDQAVLNALGAIREALEKTGSKDQEVLEELKAIRNALEQTGSRDQEVLDALRAMDESIKSAGQKNVDALREVSLALRRDDEDSVLGQIKFLKSAVEDLRRETKANLEQQIAETKSGFESQIKAFKDFATEMAENNSKALLEGLEKLISSFEEAITKHIGKNFEHLSNAVTQLVEWQENYRQQMLEMKATMEVAASGIERSRDALRQVSEAVSQIPASSERVTAMISLLNDQVSRLDKQMEEFEKTAKIAQQSFPDIKAKIERLSEEMAETAKKQSEAFGKINEAQKESAERLVAGFAALEASVRDSTGTMTAEVQKASQALSGIASAFETSVQETYASMRQSIEQAASEAQSSIQGTAEQMKANLEGAVENVQESIQIATDGMKGAVQSAAAAMRDDIDRTTEEMRVATKKALTHITGLDEGIKSRLDEAMGRMATELASIAEEVVRRVNRWQREMDGRS